MASYTFGYADQITESLNPELFTGEYGHLDGLSRWNSLDCNLSAVRDDHLHQQYNAFNPTQYTIPHSRSSSSYDGVAHGFAFAPPVKRSQTYSYQADLHTIWQPDSGRHARYLSPLSSGTSLSGAESIKSDHSLTPDAPNDSRYAFTSDTTYPSPCSEPYGEQSHPVFFQQSPPVMSWNPPPVSSLPSFSMRDFELSPGALAQNCLVAEPHNTMTTSAQALEPLNLADHPKLEDTHTPNQGAESENDEPMAQDESCNESDFTPVHTSQQLLTTPLRSSTRTRRLASSTIHAVQDSNAHISKSTSTSSRAKSKAKAARKRQNSNLARTVTSASKSRNRSFRCPFAVFGCESVFPTKNEWKRHTAAQHLQLGFYRCDLGGCSPSHPDQVTITKGHNDFNRKDLFTQHCRRMHWDECDGLQRSKIKGKEWATWSNKEKNIFESFMVEVRERCWVYRRGPPSESLCGVCGRSFVDDTGDDEAKAWEERMDHVGRHYERGEQDKRLHEDDGLRKWCEENEMGPTKQISLELLAELLLLRAYLDYADEIALPVCQGNGVDVHRKDGYSTHPAQATKDTSLALGFALIPAQSRFTSIVSSWRYGARASHLCLSAPVAPSPTVVVGWQVENRFRLPSSDGQYPP
ncbi:hypothetical protein DV737_g4055, partial [Chaetothyriales sp. CBS 132003]